MMEWELVGGMKYSEKTLPIANFSTTYPQWEVVTNRLSYGTAVDGLETQ
jgi:hypothetical protein